MVDAHPQLFMSLLCFSVEIAILVTVFLLAHRFIVVSMFGLMEEAAAAASKSGKLGYKSKAKRDASGNTKDQAMALIIDYFSNEEANSDSNDKE